MRVYTLESLLYESKLPEGYKLNQKSSEAKPKAKDVTEEVSDDEVEETKEPVKKTAKKPTKKTVQLRKKVAVPKGAKLAPQTADVEASKVAEPEEPEPPVSTGDSTLDEIRDKSDVQVKKLSRAEKAELRRQERQELLKNFETLLSAKTSGLKNELKNELKNDLQGLMSTNIQTATSTVKNELMSSFNDYKAREKTRYNRRLMAMRRSLL